jgi:hypothetical protein
MTATATADEQAGPVPDRAAGAGTGVRRFGFWLLVITAVALVVRVAYVWFVYRYRTIGGDPLYYHLGGNLLADGKGFINPLSQARGVIEPGADHPPTYIVYLAFFSLLGIRSITGHMLVSCLLGAGSVAVGGLAGRRIAGPRMGLIAAALMVVYPNVWRFDAMVLSETMVIFLVNVTILLAYRYLDRPSMGRLALVGLAVALCALTRSELVLLALFLVVPLALLTRSRPWKVRIAWLAVAGLGCALALAPWVGYNLQRFNRRVLLSGQVEATFALANCDPVYYGPNIGYWDFDCGLVGLEREGVAIPQTDDGAREKLMLDNAIDYVKAHPRRWAVVEGVRMARIFNVWSPDNATAIDERVEGNPRWVARLSLISLWPMLIGSAAGVVVLRRRRIPVFPLLAPCATVIVTVLLFYASGRFRASAEGALCLMTAVALDAGWAWWRRRGATATDPVAGDPAPADAPPSSPSPLSTSTSTPA